MLDNETDVLPVGNPVPDDPMHDRINSGQTFTPHTTHSSPTPILPPGSRTVTSLMVLFWNWGPAFFKNVSECCQKSVIKLSISKLCQKTIKNCHKCVRKLSYSELCQKCVT